MRHIERIAFEINHKGSIEKIVESLIDFFTEIEDDCDLDKKFFDEFFDKIDHVVTLGGERKISCGDIEIIIRERNKKIVLEVEKR